MIPFGRFQHSWYNLWSFCHGVAMSITLQLFQILLITLSVTFAGVPLGVWLAKRVNLIDYPGSAPHKRHETPTPMAGGIVLVLVFTVCGILLDVWKIIPIGAIYVASLVIFVFGLWDDFRDIHPILKLFGQLLAAGILIRWGIFVQIFESLEFVFNDTFLVARGLDILITFFWIVGITNAFNFIDSMDGLAVGIGGVAAGFFMLLTLDSGQQYLAILSAALVSVCMGIYFFNAHPARLFLGDAGAQVLGFWMASLAIVYHPLDLDQMSSWFTTILLLGVPIFDMSLVIISRLRRRSPVYQAARDHTYHRLRDFGLDPNRAVLLMHIVAVILGCIAVIGLYQPPLIANLIFGLVVLCGLVILIFFEISFSRSQNQSENTLE